MVPALSAAVRHDCVQHAGSVNAQVKVAEAKTLAAQRLRAE